MFDTVVAWNNYLYSEDSVKQFLIQNMNLENSLYFCTSYFTIHIYKYIYIFFFYKTQFYDIPLILYPSVFISTF